MRDIKFRAWCPDLLEMFGQDMDSAFVFHDKGLILKTLDQIFETGSGVAVENWEYIERPKAIFMQFTGLQDKNGVDIYESDVLKQTYEDGDVFGVVKYVMVEAGYITEGIDEIKDYPLCFNAYYSGKSEIVGNIHSNPELLEQ